MKGIALCLDVGIRLGLTIALLAVNGAVLQRLSTWFVAPWLSTAPITFAQATGIVVIVSLLTLRVTKRDLEEQEPIWSSSQITLYIARGVAAVMALLLGWIVHVTF